MIPISQYHIGSKENANSSTPFKLQTYLVTKKK